MSLQQQNNKLPKHLQHVRLQKEEDEEQWISGEELCTEGSSDEEFTTNDLKIISKLKMRPSTVGFKKQTTSSGSSTSNFSIPEKNDDKSDCSPRSFSPNSMQWRPKRDLDLDYFNLQNAVAERLSREIEYGNVLEELKINKNITGLRNDELVACIEEEQNNDNQTNYITDNIIGLDKELDEYDLELESCRKDRRDYEKSICSKISELNICPVTIKSSENFYKICHLKSNSDKKDKSKKKHKVKLYSRVNKYKYVPRKNMDSSFLTKEQESRLSVLLEDLDLQEQENNYEQSINENLMKKINVFKYTEDELLNLKTIDNKLRTLHEKCDADLKRKTSEDKDEENREWREYAKMNDERIRKINHRLKVLQQAKLSEDTKSSENTENYPE